MCQCGSVTFTGYQLTRVEGLNLSHKPLDNVACLGVFGEVLLSAESSLDEFMAERKKVAGVLLLIINN